MLICDEFGGSKNIATCSFICDSVDELLSDAPTTKRKGQNNFSDFDHFAPIGSTATVNSDSGILVYILFSEGWKQL